jgi:hypothetical protein
VPANIVLKDEGNLTIAADLTFTGSNQFIFIESGSAFRIEAGGESK